MATITFDTFKLVDKLKAAGIPQEQAEAVVRVIAEAQDELIAKTYLDFKLSPILTDLDIKLSPILTDLAILKWMMGVLLAGVLSLVLKAFF